MWQDGCIGNLAIQVSAMGLLLVNAAGMEAPVSLVLSRFGIATTQTQSQFARGKWTSRIAVVVGTLGNGRFRVRYRGSRSGTRDAPPSAAFTKFPTRGPVGPVDIGDREPPEFPRPSTALTVIGEHEMKTSLNCRGRRDGRGTGDGQDIRAKNA